MPWWRRRGVIGVLIGLGAAWTAGLLVVAFFYQPYRIPSENMRPNLLVGDYLYARRLAADAPIRRGDVLVFENPGNRRQTWIKRCVALPGDTVEVRDGVTYVNGAAYESALDDPAADNSCVPDRRNRNECPQPHTLLLTNAVSADRHNREFGPVTVPAGHLFLMGDNRYNSLDSRYIGPVPRDHVTARAAFFYWSWDRGLRLGRMFRRIR